MAQISIWNFGIDFQKESQETAYAWLQCISSSSKIGVIKGAVVFLCISELHD
jgi:hypothetical protein